MALTGWPYRPGLGPPAPLVPGLDAVARQVADRSARLGRQVVVDPVALLTERAALAGWTRAGATSCGGGTRLLAAADGWLAVSLARPSDVDLIPAWLGLPAGLELPAPERDQPLSAGIDGLWAVVTGRVARHPVAELEARAVELGLAVGGLPTDAGRRPVVAEGALTRGEPFDDLPVVAHALGPAPPRRLDGLVVVDLSSLWAGPLCGRILADAGATVVKVESRSRPDGARSGPAAFFDLMNAGKASVALSFDHPDGIGRLRRLLARADVVIEGSRPRALEQLGVDATALARRGPQVWLSITGHGRSGAVGQRVGFGDDAAVAGGLVAWEDGRPCFCADAVADPTTGLVAAAAALAGLASGGRWLIDVALVCVAAHLAGPTLDAAGVVGAAPARPCWRGQARALGADDARWSSG